jgi:cytochrome P450
MAQIDDLKLTDPEVHEDPYEFYALMRSECPVYKMPETGFYIVSKYQDVLAVLRDTKRFSNELVETRKEIREEAKSPIDKMYHTDGWVLVDTLHHTDPPLHTRYRRPIERTFTASRVREMTPYIDQVVGDLIDEFIDDGEIDFVTRFSVPLPCRVIADQFGVPRDDVDNLKKWSEAQMDAYGMQMTPEREQQVADELLEAQQYFVAAFEERMREPSSDMLTDMVTTLPGETPMTMNELLDMMMQLLTGGNDTTTGALSEGLLMLIKNPDQLAELRKDPSLMKNFVEELLRMESPVQGLMRMTTEDVELSGTIIPKGSLVNVRYASANRDEEQFGCPAQMDVKRRDVGPHLGFGAGTHFCPGAMLARQELVSAFTQLLERVEHFELSVPLESLTHFPSLLHRRLTSLPIRFTPRR